MLKTVGGFFTERLFWWYWFPLIIYCMLIFIQSSYPSPRQLPAFPYSDKLMHFGAYAVMGGLCSRALRVTRVILAAHPNLAFQRIVCRLVRRGG